MSNNTWYYLGTNPDFYMDDKVKITYPELYTPKKYCSSCRLNYHYIDCASIFENPTPEIIRMLQPYQDVAPAGMLEEMLLLIDNGSNQFRLGKLDDEWASYNALSPIDFDLFINNIRKSMNIPESRLIFPREGIGRLKASVKRALEEDVIRCFSITILSEKASEMLSNSGLTGFELYPIDVLNRNDYKLYTMVVTGDGGIPKITHCDCEWRQCPECHQWYVWGFEGFHQTVDKNNWDGSDFFHLAEAGGVYISERADTWLKQSDLNLMINKKRLDNIRFRPDLPNIELNEVFERNVSR